MAKRKEPDVDITVSTPSKRQRKSAVQVDIPSPSCKTTLSADKQTPDDAEETPDVSEGSEVDEDEQGSPTPKATTKKPRTPQKRKPVNTPSKADRSAKRKSAQVLAESTQDGPDWDGSAALAKNILEAADKLTQSVEPADTTTTPVKRGRGRPPGAKNKRSPTPEGNANPEERYFFQTRSGPLEVSRNSFASLGLLDHEEYMQIMKNYTDNHEIEMQYLMKLYARAFPQWKFELDEGFSVCLYGWGSKRQLLRRFCTWLHTKYADSSNIIVVNGYAEKVNIRRVFNTIATAINKSRQEVKLIGQLHDVVDNLLERLDNYDGHVTLVVNSIDGQAVRRPAILSLLARVAAHRNVHLIASSDTPTFQLLLNSVLREQFRFLFHDATTFAPYDVELSPVDDVNDLLGRKGRRVGGKDGVKFVLNSLPENGRNLYRLLLGELLTIMSDGDEEVEDADDDTNKRRKTGNAEEAGIEYRTLYQKASEEFICSSDMGFKTLLKEFVDHQMLTSKRASDGAEMLSVPLAQDEMLAILEDLV